MRTVADEVGRCQDSAVCWNVTQNEPEGKGFGQKEVRSVTWTLERKMTISEQR